ncbi:hypothetical protein YASMINEVIRUS_1549 [Yasminevirus sp. GU-2018]|uniref:Uncharacterized protein n=1 Tax=Yasminevirus sp. GU-2018 TaxID=2420051 RepID=A0A5K0UAJ1_9VIRU|nr:hypothetical protein YASMINEVIRUS_1549 [Yasminevirus sp. GU-2018]
MTNTNRYHQSHAVRTYRIESYTHTVYFDRSTRQIPKSSSIVDQSAKTEKVDESGDSASTVETVEIIDVSMKVFGQNYKYSVSKSSSDEKQILLTVGQTDGQPDSQVDDQKNKIFQKLLDLIQNRNTDNDDDIRAFGDLSYNRSTDSYVLHIPLSDKSTVECYLNRVSSREISEALLGDWVETVWKPSHPTGLAWSEGMTYTGRSYFASKYEDNMFSYAGDGAVLDGGVCNPRQSSF